MKKEHVKILVFAIQSVITVAVIVLACIFGIPCSHKDAEWVVTEATCTEKGERQLICRGKCGEVLETTRLDPLGHDYGRYKTTMSATCTQDGSKERACNRDGCDSVEVVAIDKLGHNYSSYKIKTQPTCTEDGSKERACTRAACNSVEAVVIKALGHEEAPAVLENIVKPTCTQAGGYNMVVYCAVCDATLENEAVVLDALGHTAADPVLENCIAATCIVDGSYDSVVYCSACSAELDRQFTVAYAPGHNIVITIYGATMDYACSECDVASVGSRGLEYTIGFDNTCIVTGIGKCTDEYVFIPAYYLGKEVVGIADGAFAGTSVKYVGIGRTVKTIGDNAFAGCELLDNVTLPIALEKIGKSAFAGCSSLKNITFMKNVAEIGDSAFSGCTSLESLSLPESLETLGKDVFYGCTALKLIEFSGTVAQWENISVNLGENNSGYTVTFVVTE